MAAAWRPMRHSDLAMVEAIAGRVHPGLPEAAAVFAERLTLFPDGCFLLEDQTGGTSLGYAVTHPGLIGHAPPLNSLLGALPDRADCLYLHDVALLPATRR